MKLKIFMASIVLAMATSVAIAEDEAPAADTPAAAAEEPAAEAPAADAGH
jgi:hypothetical protein